MHRASIFALCSTFSVLLKQNFEAKRSAARFHARRAHARATRYLPGSLSLKRRADGHDPSGSFSNTYIPIYARSHRAQQAYIRHIRHRGARVQSKTRNTAPSTRSGVPCEQPRSCACARGSRHTNSARGTTSGVFFTKHRSSCVERRPIHVDTACDVASGVFVTRLRSRARKRRLRDEHLSWNHERRYVTQSPLA